MHITSWGAFAGGFSKLLLPNDDFQVQPNHKKLSKTVRPPSMSPCADFTAWKERKTFVFVLDVNVWTVLLDEARELSVDSVHILEVLKCNRLRAKPG